MNDATDASRWTKTGRLPLPLLALAALVALAFLGPVESRAEGDVAAGPRTFETPQAGADALVAAAAKNDDDALRAIFGPEGKDLVQDGSDPVVHAQRRGFVKAARMKLDLSTREDRSVELVVGPHDWPFPVLLVKNDAGRWFFDAADGLEEILARRIGKNELDAIEVARAYVDAQRAYAAADRDGDEVREYARRIVSTPGTHDGLYWPVDPDSDEESSPLGPALVSFQDHVRNPANAHVPFGGYYWKILEGQGEHAPGGAFSYVINGNMIAGFALVGVPALHRKTGVMTFIVNNQGKVCQKDLGEKSLEIVEAMKVYDPDETWTRVEEPAEAAVAEGEPHASEGGAAKEDAPEVKPGAQPGNRAAK